MPVALELRGNKVITEGTHLLANRQEGRVFKASSVWTSNVWGATIAGIGGGLVISVIGGILLFDSAGPQGTTVGAVLIITIVATFLAIFPGKLIATVPIAVDLEEGKGLCLHAPLKRLYVPFDEVQKIRDSTLGQISQQGIVVKLNKRHGLMKSFVIHVAFGEQGKTLVRTIQQEISRRDRRSGS
jgi:hypothetical protein